MDNPEDDMVVNEQQAREVEQVGRQRSRRLCSAILQSDSAHTVRCIAEADESGLCPVHRHGVAPLRPQPRASRDLNADVLPWADQDVAIFDAQQPMRKPR